MKKLLLTITILVLCGCSKPQTAEVVINTKDNAVVYKVEVAITNEELQKGLMFRKELAPDSGMIFEINSPRETAMWMKNTLISLDMVFVGPDGKIVCLKEMATPMSEDLIICNKPVRAVIELSGGEIAKKGITIGDEVIATNL